MVGLCLVPSVVSGVLSVTVSPWLVLIVAVGFLGLAYLMLEGRKATIVAIVVCVTIPRYNLSVLGLHATAERLLLPPLVGHLLMSARTGPRQGQRPPAVARELVGLLIYVATITLSSVVNSPSLVDSVRNSVLIAVAAASFWLVPWALRDLNEVSWMAIAFIIVATIEAAFGAVALGVYTLSGVNLGVQLSPLGAIPYGSMWEGNIFGSFVTSALVLCIAMLARSDLRRGHKGLLVFCGLALLAGSALSQSRGAWLGGAAGVISLAILLRRAIGRKLVGFALAAIPLLATVVVLAGPSVSARSGLLAGLLQGQVDGTTLERFQTYLIAIDEWTLHPLEGWGAGSLGIEHLSSSRIGAWISNLEIHALHDSGIIGLAGLSLALGGTLVRAVGRSREVRSELPFSSSLLAGLAAACVCLLVAFQATEGTWLAYTWLVFGMTLGAVRLSHVEAGPADTVADK